MRARKDRDGGTWQRVKKCRNMKVRKKRRDIAERYEMKAGLQNKNK